MCLKQVGTVVENSSSTLHKLAPQVARALQQVLLQEGPLEVDTVVDGTFPCRPLKVALLAQVIAPGGSPVPTPRFFFKSC